MSKEFKDIFRQLLTENKISGKEAASLFRVSESTITYWSTGITIPRPKRLQEIADYFGVSLSYLMGNEPPKLESIKTLDITGLTDEEIAAISLIVEKLKEAKNG